ncbi:ABC transporter ATP-binding protein [Mycoplasma sp. Mirounga ES2805-ORL]|uniref:ABC transporter ATP-binding protein n=1 Tax=Mycoplasma sp. Mirounga ES2805-ORL TaxID=754514 RepID=UPI00197BC0AC|nr:ABC transporter ATP-binding protein [Mycoplasma sp. Mirounga ES2805-ORL]QSF13609.1 ABC transporter ATP-binding protein [Mycoplasma sp. Mirounga ES2805-ORL]
MSNDNIAIEFKNVVKEFKNQKILDNLSFKVNKGEFHGFIGANGAGKTTSFRSLLNFYPDVKGEILINGKSFRDAKARDVLGYVPEVATFPKRLTVHNYLCSLAELSGFSHAESVKKVDKWLDYFNIPSEIRKKNGNSLSSGQKKKILLIQALIHDPSILILDEPAANLDPKVRIEIFEHLKKLNESGKTIFISSHILLELEQYIDSITVLDKGRLIDTGLIKDKINNDSYPFIIKTIEPERVIEVLKETTKNNNNDWFKKAKKGVIFSGEEKILPLVMKELVTKKIQFTLVGYNKKTLNELYFNELNSQS